MPLISKRQFNRFKKFLPVPGNAEKIPARVVISCANWVIRYGRSWSEPPEKHGKYDTIRKRFARWSKLGIFRKVFASLTAKAGKSNIAMLDSTTVKARGTAASMLRDNEPRQLGKSAGSLTTKIHMIANMEKMPLDFSLTGGQVNDAKEGKALPGKNYFRLMALLGDKACDTDKIRKICPVSGIEACIPSKSNRKAQIPYAEDLYKSARLLKSCSVVSRIGEAWLRDISVVLIPSIPLFAWP